MEEVPRRTSLVPLAFPGFVLCLLGVETEGLLDYQGRAGIISIVQWNLGPVIFGVEFCTTSLGRRFKTNSDTCTSTKYRHRSSALQSLEHHLPLPRWHMFTLRSHRMTKLTIWNCQRSLQHAKLHLKKEQHPMMITTVGPHV